MEVRGQHHYEADIDKLFATFGNRDFIQAKYSSLGSRNIEIKHCQQTASSLDLEIQREVPVDAPAMLKKFIGDWNLLTQTEHWTGEPGKHYSCNTSIDIKGVPVTITGTMNLRAQGSGCINEVVLKIESKVPLVGSKLADFAGASSKDAMQAEFEYLSQYLAHVA